MMIGKIGPPDADRKPARGAPYQLQPKTDGPGPGSIGPRGLSKAGELPPRPRAKATRGKLAAKGGQIGIEVFVQACPPASLPPASRRARQARPKIDQSVISPRRAAHRRA